MERAVPRIRAPLHASLIAPFSDSPPPIEARPAELEALLGRLEQAILQRTPLRLLIEGEAGSGRSTLLLHLVQTIQAQPELASGLNIRVISEAELRSRPLARLLEHLLGPPQIRPSLLLIDRLDGLLEDVGAETEALGPLLEARAGWHVVATAAPVSVKARRRPTWRSCYQALSLLPLSFEVCLALLEARLQGSHTRLTAAHLTRARALFWLLGGQPWVWTQLAALWSATSKGQVIDDLSGLLDRLAPGYRAQLLQLAPQSRQVLWQVGVAWAPVGAMSLAKACGLELNLVSAHLSRLTRLSLLETPETARAGRLRFRLRDPIWGLWLLEQGGGAGWRRLCWFVALLSLGSPEDLQRSAADDSSDDRDDLLEEAVSEAPVHNPPVFALEPAPVLALEPAIEPAPAPTLEPTRGSSRSTPAAEQPSPQAVLARGLALTHHLLTCLGEVLGAAAVPESVEPLERLGLHLASERAALLLRLNELGLKWPRELTPEQVVQALLEHPGLSFEDRLAFVERMGRWSRKKLKRRIDRLVEEGANHRSSWSWVCQVLARAVQQGLAREALEWIAREEAQEPLWILHLALSARLAGDQVVGELPEPVLEHCERFLASWRHPVAP